MKIKVEYKNKNLNNVCVETYDFDDYCAKLAQDVICLLSTVENMIPPESFGSEDFQKFRHKVFDISGSLKRIPINLIEGEYEEHKDEMKKATKTGLLAMFGKGV